MLVCLSVPTITQNVYYPISKKFANSKCEYDQNRFSMPKCVFQKFSLSTEIIGARKVCKKSKLLETCMAKKCVENQKILTHIGAELLVEKCNITKIKNI